MHIMSHYYYLYVFIALIKTITVLATTFVRITDSRDYAPYRRQTNNQYYSMSCTSISAGNGSDGIFYRVISPANQRIKATGG